MDELAYCSFAIRIDPDDPEEEHSRKWDAFLSNNKGFHTSAIADKAVPNAQQTQEYLRRYA